MLSRRAMLSRLSVGVAALASGTFSLRLRAAGAVVPSIFSAEDDTFLEALERASFRLFVECSHPETGLVKNYGRFSEVNSSEVSSIAATGFGLTAFCIADQRGWLKPGEALARVRVALSFLHDHLPQENGFHYHFVNWATGERTLASEVSSIDTAILLCGALTCRQYFNDDEIHQLATDIYERVDWQWMFQRGPFLRHGWMPETGFLEACWDTYCEHMMLYLLAIGASKFPIPAAAWDAWSRPAFEYGGIRYINPQAPLFVHQYSHAWFDFRNRRDRHADYFQNSVLATQAHKQFCKGLGSEFPNFNESFWGITASQSAQGYVAWGGPPQQGPIDGSVVPCAAGGSLPFLPQDCLVVLRNLREHYSEMAWQRFGLVDAFNPATRWMASGALAINTGITLLMAENARTGFVWDVFMKNPEVQSAMERVGFNAIGPGPD